MQDQPLPESPEPNSTQQMPAMRRQPEKVYTPEEQARIDAMWASIQQYNPHDVETIKSYEQLDEESKQRLDEAAGEAITAIYNLASMSMKPSTLKAFNHPPVYALFFALDMDNFPDIVDSIIRYSDPKTLREDIKTLMHTLNALLEVIKAVPNKTLNPYLVERAIAYIPTHPYLRIDDLVENMPGFKASEGRDTEDKTDREA